MYFEFVTFKDTAPIAILLNYDVNTQHNNSVGEVLLNKISRAICSCPVFYKSSYIVCITFSLNSLRTILFLETIFCLFNHVLFCKCVFTYFALSIRRGDLHGRVV